MVDLITYLRNFDYDICLAKSKWTLEEAVDYLAAYRANRHSWNNREEAYEAFVSIKDQLAAAVQHGIDEGSLVIEEAYKESRNGDSDISGCELDFKKATISPLIFINWAIDIKIELPKQYEQYAARKKSDKSVYYDGLGIKKSTIHHERCRAIAELLWSMEPEIPIAKMAQRKEIIQFGCEGQEYDMRTISRWLASLKDDRKPGQPRKRKSDL